MKPMLRALSGACVLAAMAFPAAAETKLTIATVNNGDMIRMQGLTDDFTAKNPDISVEWVTLEENVAAPEGDDRHRHQGRPVRRAHHRHL